MLKRLLIVFILSLIWVGLCWGQDKVTNSEAPGFNAQAMWDFAQYLYSAGEYYRAITEYQRFLFYYPNHPKHLTAKLQIANCYLEGEQWDEALKCFNQLLQTHLPAKVKKKVLYKMAKCYYAKGEYGRCRQYLEQLIDQFGNQPEADQAYYLMGQSYLVQDKWLEAAEAFAKIKQGVEAQRLSLEARRGQELPYKSPTLAGIMSAVVPGAGQLYAQRRQDAVVAFLLNGVFIWGMVESFQHNKEVVGGILAFFELGWYGGNIFSAISSTYKYNQKLKDDFRQKLISRFKFSLGAEEGNLQKLHFHLSYSF